MTAHLEAYCAAIDDDTVKAWKAAWKAAAVWLFAAQDLPTNTEGKEEAIGYAEKAKAEAKAEAKCKAKEAEEKADRKAKDAAYNEALSAYQEKRDSASSADDWNDVATAAMDMQAAAADLHDSDKIQVAKDAKADAERKEKDA